ncbi:hypothetical protein CISG_06707 [Coccidioides immitis RMSCC 3703]|uniref:Uncharacterized protein n=2 Tax=Coccidioides immitis TaxID=5501 RepID=A0A0J8QY91_COCIT|nr:hypothetical protein CIRG_05239 [Coccidioides immitis RMSCC 2394]KMU77864.1 hypothetical protein CISG_06707 [Coccidioides immitis RMSCC 3703]
MDMLGSRESRIQHSPNTINNTVDYSYQVAAPATMRTMIRKTPWLTSKTVDEIAEDAEEYGEVHAEFMYIMLGEEEKMSAIASHSRVAQHMVSFCTIHNPQLQ